MRDLLILRGIPGSGKSTFVKENNLEDYTLSSDAIRLMLCAPVRKVCGYTVDQKCSNKAFDFLFQCLEYRMQRGQFVCVDATNMHVDRYLSLAKKYNYDVYVKDFNIPLEVALEQNAQRTVGYVDEDVIRNFYEKYQNVTNPKCVKYIDSLDEIEAKYQIKPYTYNHIKVIGDVHGHFDELEKALGEIRDDILYIFLGDYCDKGTQNKKVLDFCISHYEKPNFIFIEGNHERWLKNMVVGDRLSRLSSVTYEELKSNKKSWWLELDKFLRALKPFVLLDINGKETLFCHGGVDKLIKPIFLMDANDFIHGVGEWSFNIDEVYEGDLQIHGHRTTSNSHNSHTFDATLTKEMVHGDIIDGCVIKQYISL